MSILSTVRSLRRHHSRAGSVNGSLNNNYPAPLACRCTRSAQLYSSTLLYFYVFPVINLYVRDTRYLNIYIIILSTNDFYTNTLNNLYYSKYRLHIQYIDFKEDNIIEIVFSWTIYVLVCSG